MLKEVNSVVYRRRLTKSKDLQAVFKAVVRRTASLEPIPKMINMLQTLYKLKITPRKVVIDPDVEVLQLVISD
jgi:hypothetical protein